MGELKRIGDCFQKSDSEKEDCDMVKAIKEGAIQHKRLLDGEITQFQYETLREEILVKHGI